MLQRFPLEHWPEMTLEDARRTAESIVGGRAPGEPPLVCGVGVFPGAGASAQGISDLLVSNRWS